MDKSLKDKAKELAELFTAISNEKTIQFRDGETWVDLDSDYNFLRFRNIAWCPDDYRIKPEPRKIWTDGDPDDPDCDWTTVEELAMNWKKDGIDVIEFVEKVKPKTVNLKKTKK